MMSHKFYHDQLWLPRQRNLKQKENGYNSACVGNITEMLAPSRVFWQLMDAPCIAPSRVTQMVWCLPESPKPVSPKPDSPKPVSPQPDSPKLWF